MKKKLSMLVLVSLLSLGFVSTISATPLVTPVTSIEDLNDVLNERHWAYSSALKLANIKLPLKHKESIGYGDALLGVMGLSYLNESIGVAQGLTEDELKLGVDKLKTLGYVLDGESISVLDYAIVINRANMDTIEELLDWKDIKMTESITRLGMCDLVYLYFKGFTEAKIGVEPEWEYRDVVEMTESIKFAINNNIMTGDNTGKFRPNDTLSDVELACILSRVYTELMINK